MLPKQHCPQGCDEGCGYYGTECCPRSVLEEYSSRLERVEAAARRGSKMRWFEDGSGWHTHHGASGSTCELCAALAELEAANEPAS